LDVFHFTRDYGDLARGGTVATAQSGTADPGSAGGESIRVTVRLPETSSRLAVKLWLIDCQTRSLAAGPFWAYQFLPTLPQFQEAIVDIAVPLGCLEVQFEALTIEAETQRESHKFTVVRTIVPSEFQEPDENLLAPDNFLDYLPPSLESLEDDRLED
ncbi:MAG: hypothetical protein ACO3NK_13020, partial [Prochlorotrichaceae cyanobacterium]